MSKKRYLKELERAGGEIYRAFLAWAGDITADVSLERLAELVTVGDVDAIMRELDLDEANASKITESIRDTYRRGGEFEEARTKVNFNMNNPRAEAWIAQHSSELITGPLLDEQRESIRIVLASGIEAGRHPRSTALDIVGRMGSNGRRTGGIVGLASNQAAYVESARAQLASGDPNEMRAYLTRKLRDRRLDGIVKRAIEAEAPVAAADIDRMTARYSDRLLKLRGDTIARTESIASLNAARDEAWEQAIERGKVDERDVVSVWSASGGGRTRDSHSAMSGQTQPQGQPFVSPLSGARMMYPGDTSLGAPAGEIINCRCYMYKKVDHIGAQARAEREG